MASSRIMFLLFCTLVCFVQSLEHLVKRQSWRSSSTGSGSKQEISPKFITQYQDAALDDQHDDQHDLFVNNPIDVVQRPSRGNKLKAVASAANTRARKFGTTIKAVTSAANTKARKFGTTKLRGVRNKSSPSARPLQSNRVPLVKFVDVKEEREYTVMHPQSKKNQLDLLISDVAAQEARRVYEEAKKIYKEAKKIYEEIPKEHSSKKGASQDLKITSQYYRHCKNADYLIRVAKVVASLPQGSNFPDPEMPQIVR